MSGPLPATSAIFSRLLTAAPFTSICRKYLSCDALKASTRSLRSAAWPSEFACPNQNVTTLRPSWAMAGPRGRLAASAVAGMAATTWRRDHDMAAYLSCPVTNDNGNVDFDLVIRITKQDDGVNTRQAAGRRARPTRPGPPDAEGYRRRRRRFAGNRLDGAQQVGDAVGSGGDARPRSQARRGIRLSAEPSGADVSQCPHHGAGLRHS